MASIEETFYSARMFGGSSSLSLFSGSTLNFAKATVDLTLPNDGTSAVSPFLSLSVNVRAHSVPFIDIDPA